MNIETKFKYDFDLSNNYIINLNIDNTTAINLYALSTTLPGLSLGSNSVYSKHTNIKHLIKNQRPDYQTLSIQFILTEKWETLLYFTDHIKKNILNEKTKLNLGMNESFNIIVYITDSYGNPFLAIKYYDAIINSISGINRNKVVGEITYNIFDVDFQYSYFEHVAI